MSTTSMTATPLPQPPPYSPPGGSGHLLDKLSVLHKYRRASISVFLVTVAWMMVDSYTTIPRYRAQSQVLIEDEFSGMPVDVSQGLYYQDPEPYHETQRRILRSRAIALRVAKKLDLSSVPEFNGQGPTPTAVGQAIGTLKSYAKRPLAMFSRQEETPIEPPQRDETADEARFVGHLLGNIAIEPVRGSRLVNLMYTATDGAVAALIANTWAAEYTQQNLESKVKDLQDKLRLTSAEVQKQKILVNDGQRQLADYKQQQNSVSVGNNQNIVASKLQSVNNEVIAANSELATKQVVWKQLQDAKNDLEQQAAIVNNPEIQNAKARIAELERAKLQLEQNYGARWPAVIETGAKLEDARRQYDQAVARAVRTANNDYDAARSRLTAAQARYRQAEDELMDLNIKNVDYTALERAAETNQTIYNTLLQRENELRILINSHANNVRVMETAQVPGGPFTPDHRRDWFIALFAGLGLAIGFAFGLDYLDDTIKTPEDITKRLKLRFLGLVPSVRGERHPLLSGPVPHDFSEAFRSLRTALVSQATTEGAKTIVVTSAQPLEGKTTTAVNIAMALAVGGARVLLIDADMRRPSVHKALRAPNDRGLSQLLAGQARMREVVQRTHDPNLLVISAGRSPSNPSELLASDRMRALINGLEVGPFDWVIIDTPPILAVTDAVILAPLVSGVTFVIGAEMTRWRLAERAVETILAGNPRSMAGVLNKVDFNRNKYYYSRYYGHQYKSYYQETPAA